MGSPPADANIIDTGVTDIRLLIIGTPYSFSISSPVFDEVFGFAAYLVVNSAARLVSRPSPHSQEEIFP